ncbi:MAG: sulfotransferase [Bacteroidia bacterium]
MNPFFIIGNPRSGTSLFRLMLTTHPNIIIPPECHFFLWLEEKYKNWKSSTGTDELFNDLMTSRKFETWNLSREEISQELSNARVNSFSDFVKTIYLLYGKKSGKKDILAWGDKNKLWKEKLSVIENYFPSCSYIHIVRDGRDVACSFKNLSNRDINSKYAPNLSGKIEDIAERWKLNVNYISEFLNKKRTEQWIEIRYEDLVARPEEILKKATKFLGVNYNAVMLDYAGTNQFELYEPAEFIQWKEKLKESPDISNVGKYKNELQKQEIEYFENACRNELSQHGYL